VSRPTEREAAYAAIDSERAYQDQVWPTTTNEPRPHRHTVGEEIVLLQSYTGKAVEAWTVNEGDKAALDVIRKIAAIAVRAMELHGVVERSGRNDERD